MQNDMIVSTTYNRLLADIESLSGVSLDAPERFDSEWFLIQGPQLDKELLRYIDGRGIMPRFPDWLTPLWLRFISGNGDGVILRYIRQLLVYGYKTEQEPTNEQLESAQRQFEETDQGVGVWASNFNISRPYYAHTCRSARQIVSSVIYRIDWSKIVPSHGPGGVYPTRIPSEKSCFKTIYQGIEEHYPYFAYFNGLGSFYQDQLKPGVQDSLLEATDIVAKLVAVPKDSRGPRLICVHPSESIWIQQGQRRLLEHSISHNNLTKGKINFTDQTVNGKLALLSSQSREFVTLDLKEASDRISCELVRSLFGDYAYSKLSCSRANKIKLLDGRVINLEKWAPMGNALCFPVQSLIFFSLVTAGIRSHYGIDCNEVYVFGDDIIYPRPYHTGVMRTLVRFGLVPNPDKTFVNGFFRESCGVDAYKGINVTPIRLRKGDISSLENLMSNCDLALRARLHGYGGLATVLYRMIRRELRLRGIYMPISNLSTVGGFFEYQDISFVELLLREPRLTYNGKWQRWVVKRAVVSGQQHAVRNGDWYHLQDALLRLERKFQAEGVSSRGLIPSLSELFPTLDKTFVDETQRDVSDRPTEYAIPYRSRLTYGWGGCRV